MSPLREAAVARLVTTTREQKHIIAGLLGALADANGEIATLIDRINVLETNRDRSEEARELVRHPHEDAVILLFQIGEQRRALESQQRADRRRTNVLNPLEAA